MFILKHQNCMSQVWDKVWNFFVLIWNTEFLKNIYRNRSRTPATSESLLSVTLVKRLKAVRKSLGEPNSVVAGISNASLITSNNYLILNNNYKCLPILRRFYVKRERVSNFRPVVSKTLTTKTNLALLVGTSRLSLWLLRTALLVFLSLKISFLYIGLILINL